MNKEYDNTIKDKSKEELKNICNKYKFKFKENSGNIVMLCAKDTDEKWTEWIKLDIENKNIIILGNTDECNLWFYDTRKDMTPDLIINFVADLNSLLRKFDTYVYLKNLIDPEDWQEIANVNDAYKDDRYQIQFKDIEFGEDNYIYFALMYEERELDGLFRIHDLDNGPDMTLVSVNACCNGRAEKFLNAHWEEIENELCDYAKENEKRKLELEEKCEKE